MTKAELKEEGTLCVASPLDDVKDIKDITDFVVPTAKVLYDCVPKKCREKDTWKSMSFLVRDLSFIYTNYSISSFLVPYVCGTSWLLNFVAWTIFAFTQGTLFFGVWIIGHECGHGAFSDNTLINDTVGYLTHTGLLVPYFSWQYSHSKHHKYTNHLTKGESHVPLTKQEFSSIFPFCTAISAEIFHMYKTLMYLIVGWPLYAIYNSSGGTETWDGKPLVATKGHVDHFVGNKSQIFPPHTRLKVTLSGAGCLLVVVCVTLCAIHYGFLLTLRAYIGPYLVTNGWLVLYTWLHHTHQDCPHYDDDSFTWLRGALSTVDRPYHPLINYLHHEIGNTHVLHHVDHTIPHYHAIEATNCMKQVLGPMYRYDGRGILEVLFDVSKECHYVENRDGVRFYKSFYANKAKLNTDRDKT